MRKDMIITSHKFGKEFYIRVEDFKNAVEKIQNEYRDLEEENKKLKKELEQTIYWKVDYEKSYKQAEAKKDELLEENKKLREENYLLKEGVKAMTEIIEKLKK